MRVGVVIDSACDLPRSYVAEHNLEILPINLRFGDETFEDVRDPEATQTFYEHYVSKKDLDAESIPLSVEEITEMFSNDLILKYDRVIVVTMSARRSRLFERATKASFAIIKGHRQTRIKAGMPASFALRVIDSQTAFTGEAVLAHEAVRLLKGEHLPFEKVRPAIEEMAKHVYAYLVPDDLYYLRTRGGKNGERAVGFLSYATGQAFDIKPVLQMHRGETTRVAKAVGFDAALERLFEQAKEAIARGLRTPLVVMSYAGEPQVIRDHPVYVDFAKYAEGLGIELLLSVMSTTAGVNVGPGAFSLAYAA